MADPVTPARDRARPGFRTRGQPAAVAALDAMLGSGMPHALLLVGPPGVGKATLADDLAAALLCRHEDPAARPCRSCRLCRAAEHGNHPDLHRLDPVGAGAVIPIGGRDERGVRDLAAELALMPVEGGARVAIMAEADRMTEDAQSAFLKTLEEPPAGAVLVMCAADEERLLPTVRSRCVRIRLGPVPPREVERIVVDAGAADAPLAARVARLSSGRPGLALVLARSPEALRIRGEIARTLIDLASSTRTDRLRGIRDLLARAADLSKAMRPGFTSSRDAAPAADPEPDAAVDAGPATKVRVPAAERRAAALALVALWQELVRDALALGAGAPEAVRDLDLLDELTALRQRLPPRAGAAHLRRLETAGERLAGNVSPELVLDVLALEWVA
ncbi:MAG: AAA family ATPase [Chloroflexi bacterium]|nr:AAA family ATPase [Chloroflexota bacterium]